MKHEHLPIAIRPRADANRRCFNLGCNHRGYFAWNAFEINTGNTSTIERYSITHKLLDRIERLPLHLESAHHVYRLWRKPDVPSHRNLGVNNVVDQVSPFFAAFNFHGFRSPFFDEASSIADCFIRSGVIRAIRHVGDQERMLDSAPDSFG